MRKYLSRKALEGKIRCLLIMYGLPLKIAAPEMNGAERREYKRIKERENTLKARLSALSEGQEKERGEIQEELAEVQKQCERTAKSDQLASLDSEISLVLERNHSLEGWIPNPFFAGYHQPQLMKKRDTTLFVSRLDGPSPQIVRRVVDDSLATERSGLKGKAYFDARWPRTHEKAGFRGKSGYQYYDTSIYRPQTW